MNLRWLASALPLLAATACSGAASNASSDAGGNAAPAPTTPTTGTDAGASDARAAPSLDGAPSDGAPPALDGGASACTADQATFDNLVTALKADLASNQISGASVAIVCGANV